MTHKSGKVAERVAHLQGCALDPRYLGFFECFNQGYFYEAHDVLEDLWLECRKGEKDLFYKALIQLAGAFVHLQKDRIRPSGRLFRLSRGYLCSYPETFESLDLGRVIGIIDDWLARLSVVPPGTNPLEGFPSPKIYPCVEQ